MMTYFVTGATGAVGSAIVPRLLEDQDTNVYLLLRAGSEKNLGERLESLFRYWGITPDDAARRRRVHPLRGDVTSDRLGLDLAVYDQLASVCTHIVHCAGQVRMTLPLEEARRQAVDAASEVLALGARCREHGQLHKVEFVSTVGVSGRAGGVLAEEWATERREFHNTYEAAKAEAELLVAATIDQGLPVTVHRPSMVVGESRDGRIIHFQVFYHLCEFLSGRRSRGLCPALGTARLDTIPVDYVADAIVWSSQIRDTSGHILHLCSGPEQAIALADLRVRVRKIFAKRGFGVPRGKTIPLSLFRIGLPLSAAFAPAKQRRALRTLPIFLDYLGEDQAFANEKTQPLLAKAGIHLPAPKDYIETVLDYYLTLSR